MKKTRRGNNEGCIVLRKDGRWVGCISNGHDQNGKRIRQYFYGKTRAEVATKVIMSLNYRLKNKSNFLMKEDIQTLMTEWLLIVKRNLVSPRTFEGNLMNAKKHIFPVIGQISFCDLTTIVVQRLLINMKNDNYAISTIKKIKFLLRQFFDYAENNQWINTNPINKIRLQTNEKKNIIDNEYKAIPIEIRNKFIDTLENSELLKPICMTMLFAGLRIGEVLALKWNNIDFVNRVIKIEYALTVIPTFDKLGKRIRRETVVSNTKTSASVREVPIPNILIGVLNEWKKNRWIREKETGLSLINPTDFIFSTNNGKLRSYSGLKSMFQRLMNNSEISKYKIHFHSLRHTYATMLFESGENPKVIQMLLGHKEITTTLKIYNSIDRSYFAKVAEKINNIFPLKK